MKKNSYKFDITKQTLTLSASFALAMNDPNSAEYALVRQFKHDFPRITIVRKTHKSPAKPNKNRGLTYERMERYICAVSPEDDTDYLEAFYAVREMAETVCASPYAVVSAWFMRQFPKFRTNPLFYIDHKPDVIDFSAVLEGAKKKAAVVEAGSEQKGA